MKNRRAYLLGAGCLALILATRESHARGDCDRGRAVALDIADGSAPSGSDLLEQSLLAELAASQIAVCVAPSRDARVAWLRIRAAQRGWERASIRFEPAGAPTLERELDLSRLPPEARALAIASAADEMIRSARTDSPAEESIAPAATPLDLDRPSPVGAASSPGEAGALFEAGVAGAASSYRGQRDALEADLVARYWLLPRVPLTARVGIGRRTSRPIERGAVQPDADVHAAVGGGYAFWADSDGFDLLGEAAVQLSRVGFDERVTFDETRPAPGFVEALERRTFSESHSLDHGWALASSLGLEGRAHAGSIGFSIGLSALVPLVPARSDWGDQTSLDNLGLQLRAGVWVLLGSRLRRAPHDS
jgi:hypothetical protein